MVAESEAIYRHRDYYLNLGLGLEPKTPVADPSIKKEVAIIDSLEKEQINGALESDKRSFVAKLSPDIKHDEFYMEMGKATGTEQSLADRQVLGEEYAEQLACAVLYPSVLAPYPATFNSVAIAGIVDMVGSSNQTSLFHPEDDLLLTNEIVDRTGYLTNRMLQLGAVEHLYEDRFIIPPKKKEKLAVILENFDEKE